jgi:predicted RNA-binding Zn-ribbon protein involved in translation (DUF1610 family)
MNNSFSLTCSQCGGQIQLLKGRTRIKCPYCGTEQVLTGEIAQQVQMEGAHICPVCNKDDKLEKVSAIVAREHYSPLAKILTVEEPNYLSAQKPEKDPARLNDLELLSPAQIAKQKRAVTTMWLIGCFGAFSYLMSVCGGNEFFFLTAIVSMPLFFHFYYQASPFRLAVENPSTIRFASTMFLIIAAGVFIIMVIAAPKLYLFFSVISGSFFWLGMILLKRWRFITQKHPSNGSSHSNLTWYEKEANEKYQRALNAYERELQANRKLYSEHGRKLAVWSELYYCSRDDIVILPAEGLYTPAQDMETFVNIQASRRNKK